MSLNYAARIPIDASTQPMQNYPASKRALARYGSHTAANSSVVTLTDNTTVVEITAGASDLVMRWVAASDTQASVVATGANANFDHAVGANETRRFVVPIENQSPQPSFVGANVANGLFKRVAWKAAGANASVYGSEF